MSVDLVWSQLGSDINGMNQYDRLRQISLSDDGMRLATLSKTEDSSNGTQSGVVRTYDWNEQNSEWIQIGDDISGEAASQYSTEEKNISLSGDGNYIAIGADANDNNGFTNNGSVRIFKWNGTVWEQYGETITGETSNLLCGRSVSLSYNGTIVAVGCLGSAQIYKLNLESMLWEKRGNNIDEVTPNDNNGFTISLSSDGSRVSTADYLNDVGNVRVFEWDGVNWNQLGDSIGVVGTSTVQFSGLSQSLSGDGKRLLIGTYLYDEESIGIECGRIRIFEWSSENLQWEQIGSDIYGKESGDRSGYDISISNDGNRIAVGLVSNSNNDKTDNGEVIIYDWNSNLQQWEQYANPIQGLLDDIWTGQVVCLSGDGTRVAETAACFDNLRGKVRIFGLKPLITSSNETTITLNETSEIGNSNRDGFFTSILSKLDLQKKILVPSSAFDENFTTKSMTEVVFPSYTNFIIPNNDYGIYVVLDSDGNEITFELENNKSIRIVRDSANLYSVYENNAETATLTQQVGDIGYYKGLQWKIGSLFSYYTSIEGLVWSQLGNNLLGQNESDRFSIPSISNDGKKIAIGAYLENTENGENSGVTYTYVWNEINQQWGLMGESIKGLNSNDESGTSISLSGDGNYLAIGAPKEEDGGAATTNRGSVRLYKWNGTSWNEVATPIWGEVGGDYNGSSISLSYNGKIIAIGAPFNRPGTVLQGLKGHTRIFELNETETAWIQVGSDIDGQDKNDRSGYRVSLSSDGLRVAIAAFLHDGNGSDSGNVRIFDWDGSSWNQMGSDIVGNENDQSGNSISLSGDGSRVIIGSWLHSLPTSSGLVRVFEWNGASWDQLGDNILGPSFLSYCGFDVSISEDGNRIAIGCSGNDGTVIVYNWNSLSSSWESYANPLKGFDVSPIVTINNDILTRPFLSLAKDGESLIIASPDFENQRGKVSVFHLEPFITSSNDTEIILESVSEIGNNFRNEYFNSIKSSLDLQKTILVLSGAFNKDFTDNTFTELVFSSDTSSLTPNTEYGIYVVLDQNGNEITFQLDNQKTLRFYRNSDTEYFIYKNGETNPFLTSQPGDNGSFEGFEWTIGSLFASYLPLDVICFGPEEMVETDQGHIPMCDMKEGEYTIRGQKVERVSKNRCLEDKMVLIRQNALGENKPNKDTLVSLNHKIMFKRKYIHAQFLKHINGVEIIHSYNRVLYNVQLSTYTHMKVNNLLVETLHPNRFLK